MITPLDIQNKEFKKSFRGYKESDVDKYLDQIIRDYEKLYKENLEFKDKIVLLSEQIKQYDKLESTLKDALVIAQTTSDEVIRTAREKASVIVEEAELTAEQLVYAADEDVRSIRKEYEYLMKEIFIFKTRYKSFIEAQLITLDEFYTKIEDQDINKDSLVGLDDRIKGSKTEELLEKELDEEIDEESDDLGA